MVDESLYISTYEAALAVVATSMKKARLSIDMLILNSFMGGLLFSSGGMLHAAIQAGSPELLRANPGIVHFVQGLLFPIGLFYVVVLGADLFNSNVLYFGVGILRGAVSFVDLTVSWTVSYAFNLVGTLFVCYIIVWFLAIGKEPAFKQACVDITMNKALFSFVETMIKSMAGNFFVCLAVYLQIMAKPLHVRFFMMTIPVFTFVALGFCHAIADMFLLIMGLIASAPISVGKVVWKIMLPEVIGNIIGGVFFAMVVPWYSHLVSVESDQRRLKLPRFKLRDEQPELNIDSRVVRQQEPDNDEEEVEDLPESAEKVPHGPDVGDTDSARSSATSMTDYTPTALQSQNMARTRTGLSRSRTNLSVSSRLSAVRSPRNVFPVYGMGEPLERETTIATGNQDNNEAVPLRNDSVASFSQPDDVTSADFIGLRLSRFITRRGSKPVDEERAMDRRGSIALVRERISHRTSLSPRRSISSQRLSRANLSPRSLEAADAAAGTASIITEEPKHQEHNT